MSNVPLIRDYMTEVLHTVSPEDSLQDARERLTAHAISHLPAVEDGRLVGLLSLGDLFAMESVVEADSQLTKVRSAMASEVYQVTAETPLAEVVRRMADHALGSAIVVQAQRPIGIFTHTDALSVLARLLGAERGA